MSDNKPIIITLVIVVAAIVGVIAYFVTSTEPEPTTVQEIAIPAPPPEPEPEPEPEPTEPVVVKNKVYQYLYFPYKKPELTVSERFKLNSTIDFARHHEDVKFLLTGSGDHIGNGADSDVDDCVHRWA